MIYIQILLTYVFLNLCSSLYVIKCIIMINFRKSVLIVNILSIAIFCQHISSALLIDQVCVLGSYVNTYCRTLLFALR